MSESHYATGRRKSSIARVELKTGKGKFLVNGREFDEYFNRDTQKMIIKRPFDLLELNNQFDISVNVSGGGSTGQAGAVRLGISRVLEKELVKHGSSMDKVLKVNVYLHDLNDYHAMNKVYRGRFGDHPPVRTTVATYGGVPGNSLVEIDCIAALD